MPTSRIAGWVFAALLLWVAGSAHAADVVVPNAAWLLDQVKILTAPETEGRGSGTAGAERAARHIAAVFQGAGLAPGGDAGSYLQAFSVPTGVRLGAANSLAVIAPPLRALGRLAGLHAAGRVRRTAARPATSSSPATGSPLPTSTMTTMRGSTRGQDRPGPEPGAAPRRSVEPLPAPDGVPLLGAEPQGHQRARARRARHHHRRSSRRGDGRAPRACRRQPAAGHRRRRRDPRGRRRAAVVFRQAPGRAGRLHRSRPRPALAVAAGHTGQGRGQPGPRPRHRVERGGRAPGHRPAPRPRGHRRSARTTIISAGAAKGRWRRTRPAPSIPERTTMPPARRR